MRNVGTTTAGVPDGETFQCAPVQVLYALTAGVAGYVSALCYKVMGGTNWVRNVLLTTALFCGPLLVIFAFLNTVAIVYRSTAALPFGTICIILVIWALITFPLTVLGGIAGKNSKVRSRMVLLPVLVLVLVLSSQPGSAPCQPPSHLEGLFSFQRCASGQAHAQS